MPRRSTCASLGLAAAIAAWAFIGAAWLLNRGWFVFTRDAFSDLGGPRSCCPWLFNYGLIATGALVVAFGACLAHAAQSKLEAIGASHIALAGVFLALIGVFPETTQPHLFVSAWFFLQMDAALLITSLAAWRETRSRAALTALLATILAYPVAGLIEMAKGWPSAATLEAYGILAIDLAVACLWYTYHAAEREKLGKRTP